MKKIIIAILITLIIIILTLLIYPSIKNSKYENSLLKDIYKNTNIENIEYLNKDNNYYIVKNKEKVVVYNLNYEEVYTTSLDKIKESNLDLTYRRNKLYYVDKKVKKGEIIYTFYNPESLEEVYKTKVGGN